MPELWIKSKIRNIYALKGVYSVWLLLEFMEGIFWAFWLVNVSDQKLTFFHICLALASFKLICFFLEKPTGRLADVFGRKLVTCTGILLLSLGFFMYAFAELKPLLYVSLSVAALGWTCLNGAKQAWFLNRGNDVIANFDSRFFFIDLEFSRRLALILGAIVGKTANAISYKHPWYLVGIAGMLTLAIALFIPKGSNDSYALQKNSRPSRLGAFNPIALSFIVAANLIMGIEFAIRNIIFLPFAIGLNHGDPSIIVTVIVMGSAAGLLGQQAFRHFSALKPELANPYVFTAISAFVYGVAEFVAWQVSNPGYFIVAFAVGVFTYGWFFSLQEVILHANIDEKNRATSQSRVKQFFHGGTVVTLLLLAYLVREDNLRKFWPIAFSSQFLSAAIFLSLYFILRRQREHVHQTPQCSRLDAG